MKPSGEKLSNAAKVYAWALARFPHLYDPAKASEEFGVPIRTIRHWRSSIMECSERGNGLPTLAVYAVDRQPVATVGNGQPTSATGCRADLEDQNGNGLPPTATGSIPISGGGIPWGGPDPESLEASALPVAADSKKPKTGKPRWAGEYPPSWSTSPALINAFDLFIKHREEIKKPLTPIAGDRLISKLIKWGPDRALAALDHTMENGWQGVREPELGQQSGSRKLTATEQAFAQVKEEMFGTETRNGHQGPRDAEWGFPELASNSSDNRDIRSGA